MRHRYFSDSVLQRYAVGQCVWSVSLRFCSSGALEDVHGGMLEVLQEFENLFSNLKLQTSRRDHQHSPLLVPGMS